jgi:Peptidase_C39 like family
MPPLEAPERDESAQDLGPLSEAIPDEDKDTPVDNSRFNDISAEMSAHAQKLGLRDSGVNRRVTAEQARAAVSENAPSSGLLANPRNAPLKNLSKGAASDPEGALLNAAVDKFGQTALGKTKFGQQLQKRASLADDAQLLVRALAFDLVAWWLLAKKHWKALTVIVGIFSLCVGMAIGIPLYFLLQKTGDKSSIIALGNTYSGAYCSNMSPTYKKPNGKTLTLMNTQGGYSEESPIDSQGLVVDGSLNHFPTVDLKASPSVGPADPSLGESYLTLKGKQSSIALWSSFSQNPQSYWPYYITARWPYVAWGLSGSAKTASVVFSSSDYANMRVIMYNPATKKAALTIIGEAGPGVNEGINDTAIKKSVVATTVDQQKALFGRNLLTKDPEGAVTIFAGGPYARRNMGPSLETALGITPGNGQGTPVKIGFAPPELQNSAPGPIDCTQVTTASSGATGSIGSTPQPLNVPGTSEGGGSQCGTASVVSVARFYSLDLSRAPYNSASQTTNGCVTNLVDALNSYAKGSQTFVAASMRPSKTHADFTDVITSVTNGDPVIMYGAPDPFYPATANGDRHIFVIRGYNAADQTFDIMSPKQVSAGGFDMFNGKTADGKAITADWLKQFQEDINNGKQYAGKYFVLLSKYTRDTTKP